MLKILLTILLFISITIKPQSFFEESNKDSVNSNDIIATVDTLKITAGEFFYSYEYGPAFSKREKMSKDIYLKYMINEKLLALDGYANNLLKKESVKSIYDDIKSDIATESLFKDKILSKIKISNDELERGIKSKQIILELKWLFSFDEKVIINYEKELKKGITFDSVFNSQLNDFVFANDREMKITEFDLGKNNPSLAKIISTLKPGEISDPVHVEDGWYIIKYKNQKKNLLITETDYNKMKNEVNEALTENKIDSLSGIYVNSLMLKENPVIQRDAANVLKYYIAGYILPDETYKKWEIGNKLDSALAKMGFNKKSNYTRIFVAKGKTKNFTLNEFFKWYWNRDQYFKIPQDSFIDFSIALEELIWRMIRDKILTTVAKDKGYFEKNWVKTQSNWWKDKIIYSAERNEITNSVTLSYEKKGIPEGVKESKDNYLNIEVTKKILHKLILLKRTYKIKINESILNKIKVSSENDPKSIDVYYVKKGSLIPRTPFPVIDFEWAAWE